MAQRREEEKITRNTLDTTTRTDDSLQGRTRDEELRVPVVEEELAVGKRTVATGGVREHITDTVRRTD